MKTKTIKCRLRVGRELIATESHVDVQPVSEDKDAVRITNVRDISDKAD